MNGVSPVVSTVPYYVCAGNHETESDDRFVARTTPGRWTMIAPLYAAPRSEFDTPCPSPHAASCSFANYLARFNATALGLGANSGGNAFWYSFNDGPVHWAFVHTEVGGVAVVCRA